MKFLKIFMSFIIRVNPVDERETQIGELKDGASVCTKNAKYVITKMKNNPNNTIIFKNFSYLDQKEKTLWTKIDIMISTNAMEDYAKEQVLDVERKHEKIVKEEEVEHVPIKVVVKKK